MSTVREDLKKHYYDTGFHGMNVDERFKQADEKMKMATSIGQIMGIIAQALIDLEDSHTFFVPPGRSTRIDYGWRMQIFGDRCFVTAVKPGSDAEAKLKPGDEITSINGTTPVRENFWKIQYLYNALRPQPGVNLAVRTPSGKNEQLVVLAQDDSSQASNECEWR